MKALILICLAVVVAASSVLLPDFDYLNVTSGGRELITTQELDISETKGVYKLRLEKYEVKSNSNIRYLVTGGFGTYDATYPLKQK
jgi:hypothetical protein